MSVSVSPQISLKLQITYFLYTGEEIMNEEINMSMENNESAATVKIVVTICHGHQMIEQTAFCWAIERLDSSLQLFWKRLSMKK